MSIENSILRLKDSKEKIAEILRKKYVNVPDNEDISRYAYRIDSIQNRLPAYAGEYNITPSKDSDIVLQTENKSLANNISIAAVTSDIDPNIAPENIKKGTQILGIEGTIEDTLTTSYIRTGVRMTDEFWQGWSDAVAHDQIAKIAISGPNVDTKPAGTSLANLGTNLQKINVAPLESFSGEKLNTTDITSMENLFHGCVNISYINLINFNTANVTNMTNAFTNCTSLTKLRLGKNWAANEAIMLIDLTTCAVDHESLVENENSVLNALATRTNNPVIKIKNDLLTQAEVDKFKAKGWTVETQVLPLVSGPAEMPAVSGLTIEFDNTTKPVAVNISWDGSYPADFTDPSLEIIISGAKSYKVRKVKINDDNPRITIYFNEDVAQVKITAVLPDGRRGIPVIK